MTLIGLQSFQFLEYNWFINCKKNVITGIWYFLWIHLYHDI